MENLHSQSALRLLQAADEIRARLAGEFSAVHGISVNEFFVMLHLERATKHRLSRGELAKRMHISASTITRMAQPMEKIGLVERHSDARDARLAFMVITKAGLEKLSEARATFAKQAGYRFDERWDDAELERFSALLYRLVSGTTADLI